MKPSRVTRQEIATTIEGLSNESLSGSADDGKRRARMAQNARFPTTARRIGSGDFSRAPMGSWAGDNMSGQRPRRGAMFSGMAVRELNIDLIGLAKDFLGRWVALHPENRSVVAVGASAKEVLDAATAAGVDCPVILLVTDEYGSLAP